jgi:DNA (cytosine-5)-methyltransferase 1
VDGRGRLNPPFVEWLMGFPEGWVDGLPRTAALRCLGNAVVPQQAAYALRRLLVWERAA